MKDVEFDVPVPLTTINASTAESLRYPRVFGGGQKLTYARYYLGSTVWLTSNFDESAGARLPSPIDASGVNETGGLPIDFGAAGPLAGYTFFFDRSDPKKPERLALYGAVLADSGSVTRVDRLPAPFNVLESAVPSNYDLAVARNRVYWAINRDLVLDATILTAKLGSDPATTELELKTVHGCAIRELDPSPWVTPDGRRLFLTTMERQADCSIPHNEITDVMIAPLAANGLAASAAVPIRGVAQSGTKEYDPSLSPDMCWLYFASNRDSPERLQLYRAHRLR